MDVTGFAIGTTACKILAAFARVTVFCHYQINNWGSAFRQANALM